MAGWIEKRKRLLSETVTAFKAGLRGSDYDPSLESRAESNSKVVEPTARPIPDKYDQLRKLAELRDVGALTEDEFQLEKTKLLNRD